MELNNNFYLVSGGSPHLIIVWKPKEENSFENSQTLNRHLSDNINFVSKWKLK